MEENATTQQNPAKNKHQAQQRGKDQPETEQQGRPQQQKLLRPVSADSNDLTSTNQVYGDTPLQEKSKMPHDPIDSIADTSKSLLSKRTANSQGKLGISFADSTIQTSNEADGSPEPAPRKRVKRDKDTYDAGDLEIQSEGSLIRRQTGLLGAVPSQEPQDLYMRSVVKVAPEEMQENEQLQGPQADFIEPFVFTPMPQPSSKDSQALKEFCSGSSSDKPSASDLRESVGVSKQSSDPLTDAVGDSQPLKSHNGQSNAVVSTPFSCFQGAADEGALCSGDTPAHQHSQPPKQAIPTKTPPHSSSSQTQQSPSPTIHTISPSATRLNNQPSPQTALRDNSKKALTPTQTGARLSSSSQSSAHIGRQTDFKRPPPLDFTSVRLPKHKSNLLSSL